MKKSIWIFLFAVFLPGIVLGWLALRSAEEQQIIIERRTAQLYQKEADDLAAAAREAVDGERRAFGEIVHKLLAGNDAHRLAKDFSNTLLEFWPRRGVGFALGPDGQMVSPTNPMAEKNPKWKDFLWHNSEFLCGGKKVVVYNVQVEGARKGSYIQQSRNRAPTQVATAKPGLKVGNSDHELVIVKNEQNQDSKDSLKARIDGVDKADAKLRPEPPKTAADDALGTAPADFAQPPAAGVHYGAPPVPEPAATAPQPGEDREIRRAEIGRNQTKAGAPDAPSEPFGRFDAATRYSGLGGGGVPQGLKPLDVAGDAAKTSLFYQFPEYEWSAQFRYLRSLSPKPTAELPPVTQAAAGTIAALAAKKALVEEIAPPLPALGKGMADTVAGAALAASPPPVGAAINAPRPALEQLGKPAGAPPASDPISDNIISPTSTLSLAPEDRPNSPPSDNHFGTGLKREQESLVELILGMKQAPLEPEAKASLERLGEQRAQKAPPPPASPAAGPGAPSAKPAQFSAPNPAAPVVELNVEALEQSAEKAKSAMPSPMRAAAAEAPRETRPSGGEPDGAPKPGASANQAPSPLPSALHDQVAESFTKLQSNRSLTFRGGDTRPPGSATGAPATDGETAGESTRREYKKSLAERSLGEGEQAPPPVLNDLYSRSVEPLQTTATPTQNWSATLPDVADFQALTAGSEEGMLARFVQDRLDLIFWIRPPEATDMIFGCLIEANELRDLWTGLLDKRRDDTAANPPYVLALLDDRARAVALHPKSEKAREWKRPFVASEVGEVLPHWEAALYLATPTALIDSARGFRRTLSFTIAAAIALIAIGGWLVVADVRRQLALAQQKTDFVSNVSHELKTPLTSIRMFAELMHDRPQAAEKQGQYLRIITVEAERLTRLINNVLDFAKLERRQKRFEKKPVDLHCLITRVWEGHEMHLKDAGFTTRWEAAPPPYPVIGDEDALAQILVNLLSNAEKYSPERKDVELVTWIEDGWMNVSVLDRGMGVPDGEERKIFEAFYRAHDSLSSGIQGSGLGLTLAQRLAHEQGGQIIYEPRHDGGSRFTLRLPLAHGQERDGHTQDT